MAEEPPPGVRSTDLLAASPVRPGGGTGPGKRVLPLHSDLCGRKPGLEEEEEGGSSRGSGACKWFNARMGFGFLSMSSRDGEPLDAPVDVFVHQSKLHMEGFRSLKEGEAVEFTFKKSSKGLESLRVTGPNGVPCVGSERRPKGAQKRRSRGDKCYNCGGPDHHAKQCQLPPQPKKCHFCQSASHMVASCPAKAQPSSPGAQGTAARLRAEGRRPAQPARGAD
ncbi:protein lin-28 homolog A-like [Lampris incognitus]|uniref:protein lin-28 homolog A-like n=1 Tax=Lampris incognitus TaxID=2546036 RepID=UPI0024B61ED0|nr:protein lin-28 homolog A-like [Lampris incognitus]